MKKIIITLVVLLIAMSAMVYLYFSNLNKNSEANDLSLNAVSANTSLVFSFEENKSFYEILSGQDLFQRILGESKSKHFRSLRLLLNEQPELGPLFDGRKIYIGFLPDTSDAVDYILTTQFNDEIDLQRILDKSKLKGIKTTKLNDVTKLELLDSTIIYLGVKKTLLMVSDKSEPIQKIMNEEPQKASNFATYIKSSNGISKNGLANLYINFEAIPALLKNILNGPLSGELGVFNQKGTFATLNYNFSTEKLLFNGTTSMENTDSYHALFVDESDQVVKINNIMPISTANYTVYAITDYKNWLPKLSAWLGKQGSSKRFLANEEAISKKYGLDLKQIFPNYFKSQFATFQLASGEKFGAITLSNGDKVGQLLLDLSTEYAPDIRIFREAGIPYTYFGEPFKKFGRPYYTIIDNYMVMANNASSLQVFLNSYQKNKLLMNDLAYQQFNDQLSAATLSFYIHNKNSNTIFSRNLKSPFFKHYRKEDGLGKFESFSYQLTGDKGKFVSNILLSKEVAAIDTTVTRN
ncbi:MAG: hypothetical protein ACQUHE_07070 [Bacteroidia bacterium]